jgi:hypothetical protein
VCCENAPRFCENSRRLQCFSQFSLQGSQAKITTAIKPSEGAMKKILFSAVMSFLFTACVTVQKGGYTSLPTSRTFHAGFDRVWGVLVSEISSFAVIKTIDKTRGLITTEPLMVGAGLMSEIVLKEYAHRPPNILGTWDAGRAILSIFANSQGPSTTVRITAYFVGFEGNVTHSWMQWPTRGVLENVLLDRIAMWKL